jgi:hypothetical protein
LLLLVLMLALPLQGVMAASRLCMVAPHSSPVEATGSAAPHSMASSEHSGAPADHLAASSDASPHDHGAPSQAGHAGHGTAVPSDPSAPAHDHVGGACKLCAACCLTAAVAPALPVLVLMSDGFADYRPIVVPVPHNVADGLERPPRTI